MVGNFCIFFEKLCTAITYNICIFSTVVMSEAEQQANTVIEIARSEALILKGHQNEVFSCAWNPELPLMVASG
jgi:hypothetical protein